MGSQQPASETPQPLLPAEPMGLRFGLCDVQRIAMNIWLAPGNQLAAVSDNLGRVILVDCLRGIALRVFKGYRDAQCSFISVAEKLPKNSEKINRRHALFLVIFAPRRSCLEIWGLQRGAKVAAFTASKYGQLIHNAHTIMGVTNGSRIKYSSTTTCIFLDPADQTLREITVPFHCAMTDSNSKTAKDLHLLRRIRLCLRSSDGTLEQTNEEIVEWCRSMQTDEIRLQCLEMLVKHPKIQPVTITNALEVFKESIVEMANSENTTSFLDVDVGDVLLHHQHLETLVTNYNKLVNFYAYIKSKEVDEEETLVKEDGEGEKKVATEVELERKPESEVAEEKFTEQDDTKSMTSASLMESEFDNIQKLIELSELERNAVPVPRVRFQDKLKTNVFIEYLTVFNCTSDSVGIQLKGQHQSSFAAVGSEIFGEFLESSRRLDLFLSKAEQSGISSGDFMKLLLEYWLQKPFLYKTR